MRLTGNEGINQFDGRGDDSYETLMHGHKCASGLLTVNLKIETSLLDKGINFRGDQIHLPLFMINFMA